MGWPSLWDYKRRHWRSCHRSVFPPWVQNRKPWTVSLPDLQALQPCEKNLSHLISDVSELAAWIKALTLPCERETPLWFFRTWNIDFGEIFFSLQSPFKHLSDVIYIPFNSFKTVHVEVCMYHLKVYNQCLPVYSVTQKPPQSVVRSAPPPIPFSPHRTPIPSDIINRKVK